MEHDHKNMEHGHETNVQTKHTLKDYTPLISIFVVIILFTIYMWSTEINPDLEFGMRMFMSGFFLIFGLFKIIKWSGFVSAYKQYDIIAKRSTVYAYIYPLIEIGLGLAYFFAWNLFATNIVTIIIMLVGSYGVWLKIKDKEDIPCACIGVVFKLPMTKVTLFEDLLMAAMALVMILL